MSKYSNDGLRSRQRIARQTAILRAARSLSLEVGYDAMTMEMVADRAMISKPTLYTYFPNKLALTVASHVFQVRLGDEAARDAEAGKAPLDRLATRIRVRMQVKLSSTDGVIGRPDEPVRSHPEYVRALDDVASHVGEAVEEGQREGTIVPEIHPKLVGHILLSLMANPGFEHLISEHGVPRSLALETITSQFVRGLQDVPRGND